MEGTLAVVNIGQLVTLAGPARPRTGEEMCELGLLQDAVLLVEEGHIAAVGTYAELCSQLSLGAVVLDGGAGFRWRASKK